MIALIFSIISGYLIQKFIFNEKERLMQILLSIPFGISYLYGIALILTYIKLLNTVSITLFSAVPLVIYLIKYKKSLNFINSNP